MAGSDTPVDSLTAYSARHLRRLGLRGPRVGVSLTGLTLEFRGVEGGEVTVRLHEVTAVRTGFLEGKYGRSYETSLWRRGVANPLRITPIRDSYAAYRVVVQELVRDLLVRGARVEGGCGKFDAIFAPTLFGSLLLAAAGISLFVLENEPWWGRLIVPLVPAVLFGITLRSSIQKSWPRQLTRVDDLPPFLPPP